MKSSRFIKRITCAVAVILIGQCVMPQKTSGPGIPGTDVMKFRKFSYIDQQGTGIEAFSFLMPSGWKFEGGISWILDNPVMPAVTAFRVFNPAGREQFQVFPNRCFFWTNNQQLLGMFPPGSKYFGSVVAQPVTAQAALRYIILPEARGGTGDLKIIKEDDLPELPKALGAGQQEQGPVSTGATGARTRITYSMNGIAMEEEFYAVVETFTFPVQGMYGVTYSTLWYVDYIFSCLAEKGKLDNSSTLFQTITSSFAVNPKWYAKYSNVIEYLAQQKITQIRSVGEFSRMLSQMSDQVREDQYQQFKARGEVYDQVAEKFSDNMRGVERYSEPSGGEVKLPSGYNNAWVSNDGQYIVSDDPLYNPNEESTQHWEPLKKK